MTYSHTPRKRLTKTDVMALRDRAKQTLDSLVTEEGIYASTDNGWKGAYHSWFGRDSAITTDLICASIEYGGDKKLADTARRGLASLMRWQGKKDDETTGEERGKFPHEIRSIFNNVDEVQHATGTNQQPWYVDPADGHLKNWDSVDSTALWVLVTIRAHTSLGLVFSSDILLSMRNALEWIIRNIEVYDGFVGFTGADLHPHRQYSGLHNQGWKDSYQIYQNGDGSLAEHPIKDVLVNGEAWAALSEASDVFVEDHDFSLQLRYTADQLKLKFNDVIDGFLLPDKTYYAQALDGRGRQLPQISADVGMCLWASHDAECVIDPLYVDLVARTVTDFDMFNPRVGIRDYAFGTVFQQGTLYHGSSDTYWPFVSALVARGLEKFAYHEEALEIVLASLSAVNQLGSNIEMFVETPNRQLVIWHHPKVGQESASEQAWTAAAVYFGALFLLKSGQYLT